jgi:hypothetical protein
MENQGYEHAMTQAEGLEALKMTHEGQIWLKALVPSRSKEGQALDLELRKSVTEEKKVAAFRTDEKTYKLVEENLDKTKEYLKERIRIYTKGLESDGAQKQICTLIGLLDSMFCAGYKDIRDRFILEGGKDALQALGALCEQKSRDLEEIWGNENDILLCYINACDPRLQSSYEKLLQEVAGRSKGQVKVVPIKAPFRAMEKTAMRYNRRFKSDNLYDVVRGCIVFDDMGSLLAAAKLIFEYDGFKVLRIVDRFNTPTSSGWCDVMMNGHFTNLLGNKVRLAECALTLRTLCTYACSLHLVFYFGKALPPCL